MTSAAVPNHCLVAQLKDNPHNARTHSKRQIDQIAASIREFGFTNPVLVADDNVIVAGHGRVRAAARIGLETVPIIRLEGLSQDQLRAYVIADNALAEKAGWDKAILAIELQHLQTVDDLDITVTGLEFPEIDLILHANDKQPGGDAADAIEPSERGRVVTCVGDIWVLGRHRIVCGNALDSAPYAAVLEGKRADLIFTDPPYNVPISGHVCGKGRIQHPEFPMASGEMDDATFAAFLGQACAHLSAHSRDGSIHYICMDWGHAKLLLFAAEGNYTLKNLCVWAKPNGGMGSLYRSQHELVFVFKHGSAVHRNNIELGRHGRNRSNLWSYPSPTAFGKSGEEGHLAALHPTVKPVALVADAILDCSIPGEIILDAFLGSGTTLIAAERVRRICCGIELEPAYVDVAIRRWQRHTGQDAHLQVGGKSFDELSADRRL
jgi:DNA modification methylase